MESRQPTQPHQINPAPTAKATSSPPAGVPGSVANPGYDPAVVLQPTHLSDSGVLAFEGVLNQALATASSDIVVDLLWVQQIDAPAIQFLAQASQRASQLGKSLSFVAMDARTRRSLAEQVLQEHLHARVTWEEQITPGLEGFLSRRPARRRRYRLRRELLSQYQW